MKITFVNTLMEICHKTGCNVDQVTDAIKMANERLISDKYLTAGMGDGGGCHPRDNIAMSWLGNNIDISHNFFDDLMMAREHQTDWLADLIVEQDRDYREIYILGKAFKPETNIITGSPSVLLDNLLKERGKTVVAYDPHIDDTVPEFKSGVYFIGTKHPEFENFDFPDGSIVLDPWRYVKSDNETVKIIHIGN